MLLQGLPHKALAIFGGSARDGLFPLPVEEKASSGLPRKALGVLSGSVRDVLFSLPVEEKTIPRGQNSGLRWPFHPARRGKGRFEASEVSESLPEGSTAQTLSTKRLPRPFPRAPESLHL